MRGWSVLQGRWEYLVKWKGWSQKWVWEARLWSTALHPGRSRQLQHLSVWLHPALRLFSSFTMFARHLEQSVARLAAFTQHSCGKIAHHLRFIHFSKSSHIYSFSGFGLSCVTVRDVACNLSDQSHFQKEKYCLACLTCKTLPFSLAVTQVQHLGAGGKHSGWAPLRRLRGEVRLNLTARCCRPLCANSTAQCAPGRKIGYRTQYPLPEKKWFQVARKLIWSVFA